jgi:hypothetical protein
MGMADAQQDVFSDRDQSDQRPVKSRYPSQSFINSISTTPIFQDERTSYRALVLLPNGRIARTELLQSGNDTEAMQAAEVFASFNAVDLWDGLRFIENYMPRSVPLIIGR